MALRVKLYVQCTLYMLSFSYSKAKIQERVCFFKDRTVVFSYFGLNSYFLLQIFKCEALLRLEISARAYVRAHVRTRARTNVHFTQILRPLGLNN